jgi:pimeloyl-ACP methyl ester carboxylesterase
LRRYNIPMKSVLALLLTILATMAQADAPGGLKRRPVFGAHILPSDSGGVIAANLTPGASAANSGIENGDVILSIAGKPVNNPQEFVGVLRSLDVGSVELEIVRNGEKSKENLELRAPQESSPDYDVVYDSATAAGALRRTIITKPRDTKRHPAVLFVGGIGCYSLDAAPAVVNGYIGLIQEMTRRGFVVMRVEKSGIGDSEGVPCPLQDFDNELAGYRAGLEKLRKYDYVDPERIFIVGHSIGGLVAPVIASETPLRGVVVMSTAGRRWVDYEDINSRRQMRMEGAAGADLEAQLKLRGVCARKMLIDGQSPQDIVAAEPRCAEHLHYPAHPSYMQQVAALDPPALWKKVAAPVLLIHGTSDFVTDAAEHRLIVKAVNAAHPGNASLILEEKLDHFMREVASQDDSMRNLKTGAMDRAPMQTKVRQDIVDWLLKHS